MGKLKDSIYDFLVRKNEDVRYEYERYVQEHLTEHYESRGKHWKVLWNLKIHYQLQGREDPLIYWDKKRKDMKCEKECSSVGLPKKDKKVEVIKDKSLKQGDKIMAQNNFMNTAESKLLNRPEVQHFANRFMNFDIVSFDIFDTLIFRPFDEPNDLFMLLEDKLEIRDFARIRIEAERDVRKMNSVIYGNRECTLEDIYKIIELRTGLPILEGIEAETELELDMCQVNPYMKHVFDILSAKGKRIILVSDMYLSQDVLSKMLQKCGYNCNCIEKMFISNECNVSKANGKIFELLKGYLKENEKLVHVGDNLEVDVRKAREYGFTAFHYPQCTAFSRKSRPKYMSPLIGSAYRGIVANHIYNGINKYSFAYEHGFIYGGILALGYCNWLNKCVEQKHIEKLLFVSRDGKIYMNSYQEMFPEGNVEYVYWSRIAHLNSCAEFCKDLYLQRYIRDKAKGENTIYVDDLLELLNLSELKKKYHKYRLNKGQILTAENVKLVENLVSDNWQLVLAKCEEMKKFEIEYFKHIIGECKEIGIVDVGWTGYSELDLKKLINTYISPDINISIFLLGITEYFPKSSQADIAKGELQPYAFSCNYNADLFYKHTVINNHTNNIYVELMSQDTIPSYMGLQNKEICFDIPEVENYEQIREIHRGILDFVKIYKNIFKEYEFMFCISGRDAIAPLIHSYENIEYYKNKFSGFCFSRTVMSDKTKQVIETLGNIFEKNNL